MTLPWVTTANTVGTAQQSVYPRTIEVHRLKTVAGSNDAIGNVGYSGAEISTTSVEGEVVLLTGVSAQIEMQASGRTVKNVGLPADATTKPVWRIVIPALAIYSIRDRDIIVDDESYRYEVAANWWTPLGYILSAVREEA